MSHKILIVDDERTIIQQLDSILEEIGYETDFIPRSELLFDKLKSETFDLILLDINMPGINGLKALSMLKKDKTTKQIPVIMITSDTTDEILVECFRNEAADFITKPFHKLILKARIKSTLDVSNAMTEIKAQAKTLLKKNQDISDSINYAKTIQSTMLPPIHKIKKYIPELFIFFKPKDLVSGDFYWFEEQNNKIFLAVVDCTGHGIPGAFMSVMGDSHLNHIVKYLKLEEPAAIAKELDKRIREALNHSENGRRDGMEISLCVIDKQTKELHFTGTHQDLIYYQNGKQNIIKGEMISIGGFARKSKERTFVQHTVKYTPNTLFYLFSDGYQDQIGGKQNKKFLKKNFRILLDRLFKFPLKKQHEALEKQFAIWKGEKTQMDDVLIIGFRIGNNK